jgi:hypothetical protein
MMSNETKDKIRKQLFEKLEELVINCPDCQYRTDDPQYTCTTCWCEGGDGVIPLPTILTIIGF